MSTPFDSEKVIVHRVNNLGLSTFLVGFDINDNGDKYYRVDELIKKLTNVIPEFAFGFHDGANTDNTDLISKVSESAKLIYNIDVFQKVKDIYLGNDGSIDDQLEEKYLRRGEFGELILHLLLRDFHNTTPLLSKIFFKDSLGHAVHGFDAVHIEPETRTLWLGESKIYMNAKAGLRELVKDIKEHFISDYMDSEFMLISKKVKAFDTPEIKEKEYWVNLLDGSTKLSDKLSQINIPLLCTYNSDLFSQYDDENSQDFLDGYTSEIEELERYFNEKNDHPLKGSLNIILILFPIKNKVELVKGLHHKLSLMQELG